jgi:hypothetical protein
MYLVATCCLVSVPLYVYIHPPLMWGQCGDVQLQFVDCGLVEGLIDLFGVKTCTLPVLWVLDEPMYDTCFWCMLYCTHNAEKNEMKYQCSKYIVGKGRKYPPPLFSEVKLVYCMKQKPINRWIKKVISYTTTGYKDIIFRFEDHSTKKTV